MPTEFSVGNLISWNQGKAGNIGVVTSVDETRERLSIRLDDEVDDITFTISSATEVLSRVEFEPGGLVQLGVGGLVGVVVSHILVDGVYIYQVSQPGGGQPSIVETGLRPALVQDPLALIRSGELHSTQSTNLRLTATQLLFDHQFNGLSSLSNSRVEIKPHQVGVLYRASTNYPHRYLIADEVGLGKTIEAGLIIKELKARGAANRVLILAPSGIISQWQMEMKSKFGQVFSLYRGDTINYLANNNPNENVWTLNDNVIASTSFAAIDEPRRQEITLAGWDLVVIDEAHHARRTWQGQSKYTETNLYKLAASLSDPETGRSTAMLLLTATPMQLHRFELYSLVELLDPALFPNFEDFDKHCQHLGGLNLVSEDVRLWEARDDREKAAAVRNLSEWLGRSVGEIETSLATAANRRELTEELYRLHRLSEVLIRNRKSVVGGFMPRVAAMWPVAMTDLEREAYDATTNYVQTGYDRSKKTSNNALGFVMAIFQKLNSSSSFALRQSLLKRIEKLEDNLPQGGTEIDVEDNDIEERPVEDALGDLLGTSGATQQMEEIRELAKIVQLLDQIPIDSKTLVLNERLAEIITEDPNAKVLLFTQFRNTQEYLRQHINPAWETNVFHGQLKPAEKDESVIRFKDDSGPQLLITTEAGGEGRNFQFCSTLINYDLPWNPMKIEQRIGRLDRIGQKNPVKVINFSMDGTIEERVLEVLTNRIRLFEETIGGLDPILGDVEESLRNVYLRASTESEEELKRMETELEDRIIAARAAETQLADLIMDTKSFRQDEVSQLLENRSSLNHGTMKRFVLGALDEMGVHIEEDHETEHVYNIRLRGQFFVEFPQFAREGAQLKITFDPSIALDYETIEFLAFGHELVEALINHVRSDDYRARASHRIIVTDEQSPQKGWFFTYLLELDGVVGNKELFPVFVDVEGKPDEELAGWLLNRSSQLKREEWNEEIGLSDVESTLKQASDHAEEQAVSRLLQQQADLTLTNRDRLDQEKVKIEKYYEYRQMSATDKVESVRNILEGVSASEDTEVQRIIPVWTRNLENAKRVLEGLEESRERSLSALAGKGQVTAQHEIFSASFVEIVAERPE